MWRCVWCSVLCVGGVAEGVSIQLAAMGQLNEVSIQLAAMGQLKEFPSGFPEFIWQNREAVILMIVVRSCLA